MKRTVNAVALKEWIKGNGYAGLEQAGISVHTAKKMAEGSYPWEPKELTIKTICEVTGFSEDELFPVAEDNGDEPPPAPKNAA